MTFSVIVPPPECGIVFIILTRFIILAEIVIFYKAELWFLGICLAALTEKIPESKPKAKMTNYRKRKLIKTKFDDNPKKQYKK